VFKRITNCMSSSSHHRWILRIAKLSSKQIVPENSQISYISTKQEERWCGSTETTLFAYMCAVLSTWSGPCIRSALLPSCTYCRKSTCTTALMQLVLRSRLYDALILIKALTRPCRNQSFMQQHQTSTGLFYWGRTWTCVSNRPAARFSNWGEVHL